jgi:hypothetical protein
MKFSHEQQKSQYWWCGDPQIWALEKWEFPEDKGT